MRRHKPLRKYNPERMRKRRHDEDGWKHTYGPLWNWVSNRRCCLCGSPGGAPAHHIIPVGRDGRDRNNVVPVCTVHHQECQRKTVMQIKAKYLIDLVQEAERYTREFDESMAKRSG